MGRLKKEESDRRIALNIAVCIKCKQEKPREQFRPNGKPPPYNIHSYCIECSRERNRIQSKTKSQKRQENIDRRVLTKLDIQEALATKTRKCTKCKLVKPFDEFGLNSNNKALGIKSQCKQCDRQISKDKRKLIDEDTLRRQDRKRNLLRYKDFDEHKYHILEDYQDNKCAICLQPEIFRFKKSGKLIPLNVDHNHETNEVRALLCLSCNTALGYVYDDVEILQAMIDYLNFHNKDKGIDNAE